MNKSNIPDHELRNCIITSIVANGVDTGFAGYIPGYLIKKLEDVLEEITEYGSIDEGGKTE